MLNSVTLIGRLTKDPEVKEFKGGAKVANFTLAVDRTYKNQAGERETDFIPIVVWRKTAELCEKFLQKGSMCAVTGRLQVRNYDASDGTKRYVTEVVADQVQFFSSSGQNNTAQTGNQNYEESHGIGLEGFEEITDLEIPW